MKNYKKIIIPLFTLLLISTTASAFAINTDSLAYEQQRTKINNMLDNRSGKFGQYAESLSAKSGIFGLKTKRDMQRSIDILADIIQTDNDILRETKVLLDYKTFQQEKVISEYKENSEKNLHYMRTINKLQDENERIKNELLIVQDAKNNFKTLFFIFLILAVSATVFIFRKFYSKKR